MGEQIPVVGAGAAITALLAVILMFARTNASDRKGYWERTADLLAQWNKADEIWQARLNSAQTRLDAAEAAHARCEDRVDAERKRRRQAEDQVADLLRTVMGKSDEPH